MMNQLSFNLAGAHDPMVVCLLLAACCSCSSNTSSNNTGGTWFKPTTLIGLLELLKNYSNNSGYKIVIWVSDVSKEYNSWILSLG